MYTNRLIILRLFWIKKQTHQKVLTNRMPEVIGHCGLVFKYWWGRKIDVWIHRMNR